MARKRKLRDESPTSAKGKSAKSIKEDDQFPLLSLPTEIVFQIYLHLDYATRRALRVNGKLAEIEKQTEYQCERLKIHDTSDYVLIKFDDVEVKVPHSEVKKEFDLMRENTSFITVVYMKEKSRFSERRSLNEFCLFKAKRVTVYDRVFNDRHLESVIKNVGHAFVKTSAVTEDGIMSIYEKMRDHQLEGRRVSIYRDNVNELWSLIEKFGAFNRETLQFTATNANHRSWSRTRDNGSLMIKLDVGTLRIYFVGVNPNWGGRRHIQFGRDQANR